MLELHTYIRAFTLIATCPCLYTDMVDDFNQETLVPFKALDNFTFPLYRLYVDLAQVQNLGDTKVLQHLIANRIPYVWIYHEYTYGIHNLDYH